MTDTQRLAFIDWMKCLGMILIVVGHVAARPVAMLTPPIYAKQLGVAFFIFVTGFTLARERRPPTHVAFNRLFEIWIFGLAFAILMSVVTWFTRGTLALSNYLPLAGVHFVFDNFPANPTTWYIGTYLHLIVLWWLVLRRWTTAWWGVLLALAVEVGWRGFATDAFGGYVAYMNLANWLTVFYLGQWFGRSGAPRLPTPNQAGVLLLLFAVGWAAFAPSLMTELDFPFMRFRADGGRLPFVMAVCASLLYAGHAVLAYRAFDRGQAPAWVRYVARNTVIIFIGHMPVYYGLLSVLGPRGVPYWVQVAVYMVACLPVLGLVSEFVRRALDLVTLRKQAGTALSVRLGIPAQGVQS